MSAMASPTASAMSVEMSTQNVTSGSVKLQVLESFCVSYLLGFFSRFFESYPQVRLDLSTGFYKDTLKSLLERQIQIGIVAQDALQWVGIKPL